MPITDPAFSLGIEEEYLIVDPVTRELVADPPAGLLEACEHILGSQVGPEFLRCQIEIGTPVCATIQDARRELGRLRSTIAQEARAHGCRIVAASTHPLSSWQPQKTSNKERYQQLRTDIGLPAERLLICALHIHVGIDDSDLRIDLMNQMRYFLPHLLALTTSSPFWEGRLTHLKSYRLSVFNELPRTGIPETFSGYRDYENHLAVLTDTGMIEDGTKLWWDIRLSARFPTLETRICDLPTRMEDSLTIAALCASLMRRLWRLKRQNARWRTYKTILLNENRWIAARYGMERGLIDFGRQERIPFADLMEEMIELVREDAQALGCLAEVENARDIIRRQPSADHQLRTYNAAVSAGASHHEALQAVVDWLIDETVVGVPMEAVAPA